MGVGYVRERLSWDHINGSSINNFALDLSTKPYAQKGGNGGVPIRYDLFMQNYKNAGIRSCPMCVQWHRLYRESGKTERITTDLKSAYDYGYYIASTLGNIGVYELWNEPETDGAMFRYESPDATATKSNVDRHKRRMCNNNRFARICELRRNIFYGYGVQK